MAYLDKPYVSVSGDDEVRDLVAEIKSGKDTTNKEFLNIANYDLGDWIVSPVAVKIIRPGLAEESADTDEIIKGYDELDKILGEEVFYKRVSVPNDKVKLAKNSEIWDNIGDSKNPLDYYIVSNDRSDGKITTFIYAFNGYDWFKLANADFDGIGDKVIDYCSEKDDWSFVAEVIGYSDGGTFNNKNSIL